MFPAAQLELYFLLAHQVGGLGFALLGIAIPAFSAVDKLVPDNVNINAGLNTGFGNICGCPGPSQSGYAF